MQSRPPIVKKGEAAEVETFLLDEHTSWACESDGTLLRLKNRNKKPPKSLTGRFTLI